MTKEELSRDIIAVQTEIEDLFFKIKYEKQDHLSDIYSDKLVHVNELREEYFKLI